MKSFSKNNDLTPQMFAACSCKKVCWKIRCDHKLNAKIEDRQHEIAGARRANNPILESEWKSVDANKVKWYGYEPNSL